MKIGIDARMYGPKVGGGGLGRYVEQLVTHLQLIDRENRYVLFLKKENFGLCKITNPNFEKRLADIHWYTFAEQKFLPKIIDQERLDLVHFPHWNVPFFIQTPFVVTIHDLILLEDPSSARATTLGPIKYFLKRVAYHLVLWKAIKQSKKIIAVSQATRLSILKHFPKVDSQKISVVYEGVTILTPIHSPVVSSPSTSSPQGREGGSPSFHSAFDSSSRLEPSREVGEAGRDLILYIGNSYPHKNLKLLLTAFKIFHKSFPESKLIMAGHRDWFSDALEVWAAGLNLPFGALEFIRDPDDEKIVELYDKASLYVFPSKLEGFGLPGLEAMGSGVPVIAARAGSLPEIFGEAAVYFDPNKVEDLVGLMKKIWTDEALKNDLIKKGVEQIKKYSWKKMAGEIMEIYRS